VLDRPPVDPELAEWSIGIAEKEAADDRLVDAVGHAPDVQAARLGKVHDPGSRRRTWKPNAVDGRDVAVRERLPPEVVLDGGRRRHSPRGDRSARCGR